MWLGDVLSADAGRRQVAEAAIASASASEFARVLVDDGVPAEIRCLAAVLIRQRIVSSADWAASGERRATLESLAAVIGGSGAPGEVRRRAADAIAADGGDDCVQWALGLGPTAAAMEVLERLCSWASAAVLRVFRDVAQRVEAALSFSDAESLAATFAAAAFAAEATESDAQLAAGVRVASLAARLVVSRGNNSPDQMEASRRLLEVARDAAPHLRASAEIRALALKIAVASTAPSGVRAVAWDCIDQAAEVLAPSAVREALAGDVELDPAWGLGLPASDDDDDGEYALPPPSASAPIFASSLGPAVVDAVDRLGLGAVGVGLAADGANPSARLAGFAVLERVSDNVALALAAMRDPEPRLRAAAFETLARARLFDQDDEDDRDDDDDEEDFWDGLANDVDDCDGGTVADMRLIDACLEGVLDPDPRVATVAANAATNEARPGASAVGTADRLASVAASTDDPLLAAEAAKAALAFARLEAPPRLLPVLGPAARRWLEASGSSAAAALAAVACVKAAPLYDRETARVAHSSKGLIERGYMRGLVTLVLDGRPDLAPDAVQAVRSALSEKGPNLAAAVRCAARLLASSRGLAAVLESSSGGEQIAAVLAAGLMSTNSVADFVFLGAASKRLLRAVGLRDARRVRGSFVGSPIRLDDALLAAIRRIPSLDDDGSPFAPAEALAALAEALGVLAESPLSARCLPETDVVETLVAAANALDPDDEAFDEALDAVGDVIESHVSPVVNLPRLLALRFAEPDPFVCSDRALDASESYQTRRAACLGLSRLIIDPRTSPPALNGLLDLLDDDDLRPDAVRGLLTVLPALPPSAFDRLLARLPIVPGSDHARSLHARFVSCLASNGMQYNVRSVLAALAAEQPPPPWAALVLDRRRDGATPYRQLLLRRNFATEAAALEAATAATAQAQLVDSETRALVLRLTATPP